MAMDSAEEEKARSSELPRVRVKKIMTVDKEVQRVSSEALFLVSLSTQLFLEFLAENSAKIAIEKKRKTVNLEHLRIAVKRHRPTSDFLLDSLPMPLPAHKPDKPTADTAAAAGVGSTRRIDHFFRKSDA